MSLIEAYHDGADQHNVMYDDHYYRTVDVSLGKMLQTVSLVPADGTYRYTLPIITVPLMDVKKPTFVCG